MSLAHTVNVVHFVDSGKLAWTVSGSSLQYNKKAGLHYQCVCDQGINWSQCLNTYLKHNVYLKFCDRRHCTQTFVTDTLAV